MGAGKRAFRARLPLILTLSTRYKTGWNVTKCHACHAKRHDNLLGNFRKGEILQLPPIDIVTCLENQRLETRHVGATKRAFRARRPPMLPIDTATCLENQRLETRHVGATKRAFHARRPPILTLCSLRIDVFLRVLLGTSKFATSTSMFRARLPSIFSTSHKLPRLPRNLHLVAN